MLLLCCYLLLVSQWYISIIEWVDAGEVEGEHCCGEQWIDMSVLDGFCIGGAGALDELRCDECVWGRETNDLFSGGVALDDDIVAVFEMSAGSEASVSEQIAMQLEDCIWGRWNVVVAFVDGGEYVAIAGDFLLGTIAWRGFSATSALSRLSLVEIPSIRLDALVL